MKAFYVLSFLLFAFFFSYRSNAQNVKGKTEILILGTQHLKQINGFKLTMLDKLIAKLNSFEFDAVCIENMPAQLLYDIQSRKDSAFVDVLDNFGGDRLLLASQVQEHFNLNYIDAQSEINKTLKKNHLTFSDRENLIQDFLASGDLASAVLQRRYIQETNEYIPNSLSSDMNKKLEEYSQSSNEIYSLAIPLAFNRNIQKIEYIDNFQDEAILLKYFPEFIQDYLDNQEIFKNVLSQPVFQKVANLLEKGVQANDILELFEFINSKEYQKQDFEAQWGIWLKTNFPSGSDRARYNLWEMRNLLIAANIMNTAAFYPEKRILVIIGASHKLFLEKYLHQIPSIELIEFK